MYFKKVSRATKIGVSGYTYVKENRRVYMYLKKGVGVKIGVWL